MAGGKGINTLGGWQASVLREIPEGSSYTLFTGRWHS